MIWIIAGTSEAREIINRISDLDFFIASLATDEGRDFISSDKLLVGRMNYDEMKEFAIKNKVSMVVDLSHPYAKVVSNNSKKLASELNIKYIRYVREKTQDYLNSIVLNSYQEAYDYLMDIEGNVFFTTGSKNIGEFEKIRGKNRFIYRVLPLIESIEKCKEHNVDMRDIVAALGPFSTEYNKAIFQEYKAEYVVMKDSGDRGGTLEKIKACRQLGILAIVIGREKESGIRDLDEIEAIIRKDSQKAVDE